MLLRSNPAPLTIGFEGPMRIASSEQWTRLFKTLTKILRFHLSRIKSLTIDAPQTSRLNRSERASILSLLDQPAPMMERLEILFYDRYEEIKLPNGLFTISSRLRHLVLKECWMTWDPKVIDFGNLRSLKLYKLPQQTNPSLYQLLELLRQTSHLESFHLEKKSGQTDETFGLDDPLLPGINPVTLKHLGQIALVGDFSYCVLLNHIVFSLNAWSIRLIIQDRREISSALAQALAGKFDDSIEGSTLSLSLDAFSIRLWKSKDTTQVPSFGDTPTIHIVFSFSNNRLDKAESFWQLLRLDQLISLDIYGHVGQNLWELFSKLPKLRDLCYRLYWSFPNEFLNVFHDYPVEKSTVDTQPDNMSFPALRNLTIFDCNLDMSAKVESNSLTPGFSVVELMLSYFELRKNAGMPLASLRLQSCKGVDSFQLERLRVVIDQVELTVHE